MKKKGAIKAEGQSVSQSGLSMSFELFGVEATKATIKFESRIRQPSILFQICKWQRA